MSDSQTYEKLTVSSDGITVDKRFEEDEFPVPAIAFEIQSERDETATVTLLDDVPADVAVEDLGFHPEYGSEFWTIDDDQITFGREIDAGESYTTVYGIRATGTDNVEQFLTEPTIAAVDPAGDADPADIVGSSGSDAVRDVISGDSDSVPGLDSDDEDIETLDLTDPNAEEAEAAATEPDPEPVEDEAETDETDESEQDDTDTEADAEESTDGTVETTTDESVAAETLTRELAAEIRNGNVSGDDIKLLRQAFELAGKEGGSVDARLEQLQTDVSDLRAYTSALEEFLEENGTGQQLIEELQSDIDGIESDLSELDSRASDNSAEIDSIQETVTKLESLEDDVSDLKAMEDTVDDLESMQGTVDDLESMQGTVDDLEDDVEKLLSNIKSVENDIADLDERIGDADGVGDQIEDLYDEIEELKEWREQLSSVIGG